MASLGGALHSLPARLGRFQVLAPLGVGGMATVFLARAHGAHGFERLVAIKLMHPHLRLDASWTRQFIAEARIAAEIVHPNVVAVTDVGDDDAGLYLVMDYVEGDSLSGLLKEAAARGERVPLGVALRILVDALAGLHAAHELRGRDGKTLGLVHRDFSPQNVLVGVDGTSRLTDFGIAKTTLGDHTRTGMVKGKLVYMPPEQLAGQPLDRSCDVWAGGVMAWELATGQHMYPLELDEMATVLRVASSTPVRVSSIRPEISAALDDTIAAALVPKRSDRIATAEALRARLLETGLVDERTEVARYVAKAAEARITALRAQATASYRGNSEPLPSSTSFARLEPATTTAISAHRAPVDTTPARKRLGRLTTYALLVSALSIAAFTAVRSTRAPASIPPVATSPLASEAPSASVDSAESEVAWGQLSHAPNSSPPPPTTDPSTAMSVGSRASSGPPSQRVPAHRPSRTTTTPARSATPTAGQKPLLGDPLDAP